MKEKVTENFTSNQTYRTELPNIVDELDIDVCEALNCIAIPTLIIDRLMAKTSPSQFKCMMLILRGTIGDCQESAQISIKCFIKKTGLCRMTVLRSIKVLEKKKFVSVKRSADNRKFNEYKIKMEAII